MTNSRLNYNSVRSEKARIAVRINKITLLFLALASFILIVFGLWSIIGGLYYGWVLVGLSVLPIMAIIWYESELKNLKPIEGLGNIDDVLAFDILGHLSKKPTPKEIAFLVSNAKGGQFFSARFGLGSGLLNELSSADEKDTQKLWDIAIDIKNHVKSKELSAVILTVALIKIQPNYHSILNRLQLDYEDLIDGIKWYDYLISLVESNKLPKRTGGIARDWSFGWTPLLNRYGVNISSNVDYSMMARELKSRNNSVNQLIDIFSKNGKQSAVLVGPIGVGKTEVIHAFASKIMDASQKIASSLKFHQIFMLDSSSLIASASERGELEKLMSKIFSEAYRSKNIIICLDNAQLFFNEGIGSVDISNIILPILESGALKIILTIDEQEYLKISSRNPQIVNLLNRISISIATKAETLAVMQDKSIVLEFQNNVTFMYQALAEAYRLGDRYVYDLSMPGKALKVLASSVRYCEDGLVTAKSVQAALEDELGVKISVATDQEERDKLLNLENLIHKRMINQKRAVSVVSDALRRARAGVKNQSRPIGTFLFLGPTGVGKTELAKALASVYFGGDEKIVRLDMNEYLKASDASRLIDDGVKNANSLTARIMKQPFSVVLLDEIEKAHPNVLSVFLQMMDEGILRDVNNREVNFRDSIIIATSNAGVEIIREYIDRGYDVGKIESQIVEKLIDDNQFRPEFLNRFDEVVVFKPLEKSELIQIVDLMISGINQTLSSQKISVSVPNEVKEFLVQSGYDPKLGARPMRRIVQRAVENIVAKKVLSGYVENGDVIEISLDQVREIVDGDNAAYEIANNAR